MVDANAAPHGAQLKRELRAGIRAARAALGDEALRAAREGLTERLAGLVAARGARSLSCFLPIRSEPDTRGFLERAAALGIEVLLPSVREDGRLDWIVSGDGATRRGAFGIDEPLGEVRGPFAVAEVELMLVPAAAVDLVGTRLGWGRGFFDRALSALPHRPPVYAVVHDHEVVDRLPREPHDVPVDGVVTPLRALAF